MKLKQALAGIAALASFSAAHAQSANTFYVTTGWFHFSPQDSSDPLKLDSMAGVPINREIPDTGAGVGASDTLGLSFGYFVTDHFATEAEVGIPPKFSLYGEGVFNQFGKVGQARLWSPALLFKYYFNTPDAKFRPYAGVGVTYVWFTDAQITNGNFTNTLGGPTSVSTDRSWAPVFNVGFNYNFTKHWFAGFSLSYIPVSVTATLNSAVTTQVGTFNRQSEAKIRLNPIVTFLKVGYNF
jgi:outer membrane protein